VITQAIAGNSAPSPTEIAELRGGSAQKLRKRLRGDLDNIVLMALRKGPQRRYASVEQFAADIRRNLENLPVSACRDTVRYRVAKFVSRHKAGVGAALAATVILLAALTITVREARIAGRQAALAREQRARAERRFNDVRKLANSLIFEIHDSIQNLPAATASRKLLLDRALEYLDSLSLESSDDISLQRELAAAYERIGILEGNPQLANLGNLDEAAVSLRKGVAIRQAVAKANPNDVKDELSLAVAHRYLGVVLRSARQPGARNEMEAALAITTARSSNPDLLRESIVDYSELADFSDEDGEPEAAVEVAKRALTISQEMLSGSPQDKALQRRAAKQMVILGYYLSRAGSRTEALQLDQQGVRILESFAQDLNDATDVREAVVAAHYFGWVLAMNGEAESVLKLLAGPSVVIRRMARSDPRNADLQSAAAGSMSLSGTALVLLGRYAQAEEKLRGSAELYESILQTDSSYSDIDRFLGCTRMWLAEAQARRGMASAALEERRKGTMALEAIQQISGKSDPNVQSDIANGHAKIAATLAHLNHFAAAADELHHAVAALESLISEHPGTSGVQYAAAETYFDIGELARISPSSAITIAGPEGAKPCYWYKKSADAWSKVTNPGSISPARLPTIGPQPTLKALAQCRGE
jgi:non-specific serine/threonine protein kinase/serine/threonine-protein kinase